MFKQTWATVRTWNSQGSSALNGGLRSMLAHQHWQEIPDQAAEWLVAAIKGPKAFSVVGDMIEVRSMWASTQERQVVNVGGRRSKDNIVIGQGFCQTWSLSLLRNIQFYKSWLLAVKTISLRLWICKRENKTRWDWSKTGTTRRLDERSLV